MQALGWQTTVSSTPGLLASSTSWVASALVLA